MTVQTKRRAAVSTLRQKGDDCGCSVQEGSRQEESGGTGGGGKKWVMNCSQETEKEFCLGRFKIVFC